MLDQLDGFLNKIRTRRYEDNIVDRLNYQMTAWLLLVFAITLSTQALVGKAIKCWVPAQFQGGWEEYVEDYCFVENTYFVPLERRIPTELKHRDSKLISYYQWVPFVLALMALMFFMPHIIWRSINFLSGLSIRSLVSMACEAVESKEEKAKELAKMIATSIHDSIQIQVAVSRSGNPFGWIFSCGMTNGSFVVVAYLITKILFAVNVVGQFFILKSFLGASYEMWGFEVLRDLVRGHPWRQSGSFPRVTLCDFNCVLMINMFIEVVFIFIWWWFILVSVITILDLLYWAVILLAPSFRDAFVERLLNAHSLPKATDQWQLHAFCKKMLLPDGAFALRMMTANAGELVASKVAEILWLEYVEKPQHSSTPVKPKAPVEEEERYGTLPERGTLDETDPSSSLLGSVRYRR